MSNGNNNSADSYGTVLPNQKCVSSNSLNTNLAMAAQHSIPISQNDSMIMSSPSYSNQHSMPFTPGGESPQYPKDREHVHISVFNSPQHYQQHSRLSSNSGSDKVSQAKYGARSNGNVLPDRRNIGRENQQDQNRLPQVYSTYPATQIQSPQLIQAGSTSLMHSHQMLHQSPQSHNQKEITSSQNSLPQQQRQSSQQSEITQQLGKNPMVPIQQSISLQNPSFQIQQRAGSTASLRGNTSQSASSMKSSTHHHQINISQQLQHLPQSPGCQIVQQQQCYVSPSPLSQQSHSSNNLQSQAHDNINTNIQLTRINDSSSHSIHQVQDPTQHQAAPPQPLYHTQLHPSQSLQLNSPLINDAAIISSQNMTNQHQIQSRRSISNQPQHQFTSGPAPVQLSRSPPVTIGNIGLQQSTTGSTVLHSGGVPQRIYIQHHNDNLHLPTDQVQHVQNSSQTQHPRQQQHFVSLSANQQLQSQSSSQASHHILLNENNTLEQTHLPPNQIQSHQQVSQIPTSIQHQQSSLYIGSQRYYTNSILSATAAVSSNSLQTAYGDGILVAAAPPPSSVQLSSVSEIELTSSSGTMQPKEMYRELKRKFKYLVYENEYYQEELRNLQRKLLKLSRDKNFLLDRLGSYEIVSESSDDSDTSMKTIEDKPAKVRRRNTSNKPVISRKRASLVINGNMPTSCSNMSMNGSMALSTKRTAIGNLVVSSATASGASLL